jgi:hypothetical protein
MTDVPAHETTINSIPPSPLMPPGYGDPAVARVNATAVTVIGIVLLCFAVLGLTPLIACLFMLASPDASLTSPLWAKLFATLVATAAVCLYLTMGIGLLKRARWSRVGAIVSLIALYVLGTLALFLLLATRPEPPPDEITSGGENVVIGVIMTLVIVLPPLIKGTLIYFLTRQDVSSAFTGRDAAQAVGLLTSDSNRRML